MVANTIALSSTDIGAGLVEDSPVITTTSPLESKITLSILGR